MPPLPPLQDKEIQKEIVNAIAEGKDVFESLKVLGLTMKDVIKYKRKDAAFAEELDEAAEALAERIFYGVARDGKRIDEGNAQAMKTRLDYAKYLLRVLNPLKFTERQELTLKHQQVIPVLKLSFASDKGQEQEALPAPKERLLEILGGGPEDGQ